MISAAFKDPEDCVDPVAVGSTKNGEKARETKAAGGGHGAAPAGESEAAPAAEGGSADVVAEAPAEEPPETAPAKKH